MKNSIYVFIAIVFIAMLGWCIISNNRYESLSYEYEMLKFNQSVLIDSLNRDNKLKENNIKQLEESIADLESKIDSLKHTSNTICIVPFKQSVSLSEGVEILKRNLQCVEL